MLGLVVLLPRQFQFEHVKIISDRGFNLVARPATRHSALRYEITGKPVKSITCVVARGPRHRCLDVKLFSELLPMLYKKAPARPNIIFTADPQMSLIDDILRAFLARSNVYISAPNSTRL